MTPQQSICSALLKLGEDGVWFCPECGLRLELPPPRRGGGGNRRELNPNAYEHMGLVRNRVRQQWEVLNETMSVNALEVQEGTRVQDCADRSGPYSNPID